MLIKTIKYILVLFHGERVETDHHMAVLLYQRNLKFIIATFANLNMMTFLS